MKAILRHVRISPKKANLVAGLVRKKSVKDALDILKFTNKKTANFLGKLIASAKANATHNMKQKEDHLFIEEIIVNEGATLKRWVPVSRGRAHPLKKRTSHITVKLGIQEPTAEKLKGKKAESEPVKEEKSEEKEPVKAKKTGRSESPKKVSSNKESKPKKSQ